MPNPENKQYELFIIIVNSGSGSKVLKIARQNGVSGGTVFIGRGTAKNRILQLLDLSDIRKEIVLLIAEKNTAYTTMNKLNKELSFNKPNHGIAFSIPLRAIVGARGANYNNDLERSTENIMYNAIFVIVDKGRAEDVIDAATKAGSRGGTIFNARGSGIHENQKLFSMAIEPEKEIVMILSEINTTQAIVSSIRNNIDIDKPGKGILFVVDVNKTYGLY